MKLLLLSIFLAAANSLPAFAQAPSFTQGPAEEIDSGLFDCSARGRVSAVGTIQSDDGKTWITPAATHFKTAPKAADLYNECAGNTPSALADVDVQAVPVLDAGGGEEFVAYIFADNYFEFHVNGQLLAVDPVPFTPFNSTIIRFTAQRPLTLALQLVDWEENLGLGSERGRGSAYHPGDGGVVMHLKNSAGETVALTDGSWRAQTFYTGPLQNKACLQLMANVRDSSACSTDGSDDGAAYFGARWVIPKDWALPQFDDTNWPAAVTFSNDTVGVRNKRSYTNFSALFDTPGADAQFIWSSNLILDNLVLVRKTVP